MNKTFKISVEMRGLSKILIQSKLLAEDQNKINNLTETEREARWSHFYWLFFCTGMSENFVSTIRTS